MYGMWNKNVKLMELNIQLILILFVLLLKHLLVGKPASSTWDSLGGTIQMGTIAKVTADQNHTLIFAGNNDIPINSFQINVARERGLVFDENNILSLQYIDPIPTKRDNTVTYYAGDIYGNLKPMRYISLSEGTGIALSTKMIIVQK